MKKITAAELKEAAKTAVSVSRKVPLPKHRAADILGDASMIIVSTSMSARKLPKGRLLRPQGSKKVTFGRYASIGDVLLARDPLEAERRALAFLATGKVAKAKALMELARKRDRAASQRSLLQAESRSK